MVLKMINKMAANSRLSYCTIAALLLLGCSGSLTRPVAEVGTSARAPAIATSGPGSPIIQSDGRWVGRMISTQAGSDVAFGFTAAGLVPGTYHMMVHEVGRCDPPDFLSAGSTPNLGIGAGGRAAADLGPTTGGDDGRLFFTIRAIGLRLLESDPGVGPPLLDRDGSALILHSTTSPAGSDARIGSPVACAVVRR